MHYLADWTKIGWVQLYLFAGNSYESNFILHSLLIHFIGRYFIAIMILDLKSLVDEIIASFSVRVIINVIDAMKYLSIEN